LLSGYSFSWQAIKKEKKTVVTVEVLNMAAKYCSPILKGEFFIIPNI
jgi:hypothetical protein